MWIFTINTDWDYKVVEIEWYDLDTAYYELLNKVDTYFSIVSVVYK